MWSLHLQTRIYADDLEAAAYKNVALDADGGVVGVASAAAAGGRAWYATAVAAAIRRVGIGGALMDALLAAADAADVDVYLHVATDNVAALALYRSRGFEDAPPPADAALVATLEAEIEGAEKAQALLWRPRAKG
jgi:GNAT superfamily N-acetyltransferase